MVHFCFVLFKVDANGEWRKWRWVNEKGTNARSLTTEGRPSLRMAERVVTTRDRGSKKGGRTIKWGVVWEGGAH